MLARITFTVVILALLNTARAFLPMPTSTNSVRPQNTLALQMAIDYNDPVVAEEFAKVQPMAYEDVEVELNQKGIRLSPTTK